MDRSNRRKRKRINYFDFEPEEPAFDEYVYCENCYDFVYEYCSIHGPLLIIPDNKIMSRAGIPDWVPRAALTTPRAYVHIAPSIIPGAGLGVFSSVTLPRCVRFGPYQGRYTEEVTSMYCWQVRKRAKLAFVDGADGETSNWMRFVNCARNREEQNLVALQYQEQIYYRAIKIIPKFTELLVYYGSEYANALGIDFKNYNKSERVEIAKYVIEDVYANTTIAGNHQTGIYKTETFEVGEEIPRNNNFDGIVDTKEMANVVTIDADGLKNTTNNVTTEINDKSNFTHKKDIQPKMFNESLKYEETIITPTDGDDFQQNIRLINNIDNQMSLKVQEDPQPKVCDKKTTTPSDGEHFLRNTLRLTNNFDNFSLKVRKDIKPKVCDICNKVYATNWSLKQHKMVHEEPRMPRYYCTHCSYKTNKRFSFTIHMDRHTKHKIFQCELCAYVGHVRKDLWKHVKRIHRNKT